MKKIEISNIHKPTPSLDKKKVDTSSPKKPFSQFIKKPSEDASIQSDKTERLNNISLSKSIQEGLDVKKQPLIPQPPKKDLFIQPDKPTLDNKIIDKLSPKKDLFIQPDKPTLDNKIIDKLSPKKDLFIQPDKPTLDNKIIDKLSPKKTLTDYIKLEEPISQIPPPILMKPPDIIQPTPITQPKPIDQILPPQIIDKIVQKVRVGINEVGNTEFQFDLKSDVLGGLKLKVNSSQEGKISISFITDNIEVKNTIEANINNLENSLQERGLPEVTVFVGSESTSSGGDKYSDSTPVLPNKISTQKETDKPKEGRMTIAKPQSATDYTV